MKQKYSEDFKNGEKQSSIFMLLNFESSNSFEILHNDDEGRLNFLKVNLYFKQLVKYRRNVSPFWTNLQTTFQAFQYSNILRE